MYTEFLLFFRLGVFSGGNLSKKKEQIVEKDKKLLDIICARIKILALEILV